MQIELHSIFHCIAMQTGKTIPNSEVNILLLKLTVYTIAKRNVIFDEIS